MSWRDWFTKDSGRNKAPQYEHKVLHLAVIFCTNIPEASQVLAGLRGTELPTHDMAWIFRALHVEANTKSITFLQIAPFVNETMDSGVLRQIGHDLHRCIQTCLTQDLQTTVSSHYLHLSPDMSPSLAMQRNFRALQLLSTALCLGEMMLTVVSMIGSSNVPHHILRSAVDSHFLLEHLTHPSPQTNRQLISWIFEHPFDTICSMPNPTLGKQQCFEIFSHAESTCFQLLQAERTRLLAELDDAQGNWRRASEEAGATKKELQRVNNEYSSLLQKLSLRDNHEISEIVRQFRGLNDEIEEISLEFSGCIPKQLLEQYPHYTACYNPAGLRLYFGDSQELPLILQSSRGASITTNQLMELYTGSILCQTLNDYIFGPFYPFPPGKSELFIQYESLARVYAKLRLRDSQMLSAKWRVDAFSSLLEISPPALELGTALSSHMASTITTAFSHLFGNEFTFSQLDSRLNKLVARALELNHILKSQLVHADLHVEFFHYNAAFDPSIMKVLDSNARDSVPEYIVSTCGLGVRASKSVGGGMEPESSVVLKATVASEKVYE